MLHTSFRLAPKSVTLNDTERHNNPYLRSFTEFGSFGVNYMKVVDGRPLMSAIIIKMSATKM